MLRFSSSTISCQTKDKWILLLPAAEGQVIQGTITRHGFPFDITFNHTSPRYSKQCHLCVVIYARGDRPAELNGLALEICRHTIGADKWNEQFSEIGRTSGKTPIFVTRKGRARRRWWTQLCLNVVVKWAPWSAVAELGM